MTPDLESFPAGTLICGVGAAGSGKSTIFSAMPDSSVVCLDELRLRLADDAGNQRVTPQAVRMQNLILRTRMELGLTTGVDSTNVEERVRASVLTPALAHGRRAVAVVFLTPLSTCLARNALRPANRRVPDDRVVWQHRHTPRSAARLRREGFADVYFVGAADAAPGRRG
ncbi:AAA family ATPase [Streptomyces bottropensis]|uniref:AAA family ATPase n=1 Tax=Streptomyces bottropensis TaxID=42235 RepID=UPI003694335E